jgi:oligoendopeptidase F
MSLSLPMSQRTLEEAIQKIQKIRTRARTIQNLLNTRVRESLKDPAKGSTSLKDRRTQKTQTRARSNLKNLEVLVKVKVKAKVKANTSLKLPVRAKVRAKHLVKAKVRARARANMNRRTRLMKRSRKIATFPPVYSLQSINIPSDSRLLRMSMSPASAKSK